jgi:hypothetical protein
MNIKYYVYAAFGVNDELLYIGKGSGNRYKHCLSGASNCRDINRYYFQNGEAGCIRVKILKKLLSNNEALHYEIAKIKKLKPLFNSDHNNKVRYIQSIVEKYSDKERFEKGYKVDFARMMNEYIKSIEEGDLGTTEMIQQKSNLHKEYVDVLGIERIKSLGSNKTKLTNAYNLAIKFSDNNLEIKSRLSSLRVGGKYTSADIVNLLQGSYDTLGIDRLAMSNDIKNYFIVSKTQVVSDTDGKRKQGFKIISDLYK